MADYGKLWFCKQSVIYSVRHTRSQWDSSLRAHNSCGGTRNSQLVVLLESLKHLSLSASTLAALDLREICIFLRSNRLSARLAHGAQMAASLINIYICSAPLNICLLNTPLAMHLFLSQQCALLKRLKATFLFASETPQRRRRPILSCSVWASNICGGACDKSRSRSPIDMRLLFAKRAQISSLKC